MDRRTLVASGALAAVLVCVGVALVCIGGCVQKTSENGSAADEGNTSTLSGNLTQDIKNADHIVWMFPHEDDEVYVAGLLAMAGKEYGKKTSAWRIGSGSAKLGTESDPIKTANERSKEVLGLYDYAYIGTDIDRISDRLKQEKPDLIITFEPTNGYGNPGHVDSAARARDAIEKSGIRAKLYYVLNKDEKQSEQTGRTLDPGTPTDVLDLDAYSPGAGMTYWEVKWSIIEIYAELFRSANPKHDFVRWVDNPHLLDQTKHEEYYRKVN